MASPAVGISLMLEPAFARAALPLFEAGLIDAIEWSFDTAWDDVPAWATAVLDQVAAAGRLYGHGVHYSPLSTGSAITAARQHAWLDRFVTELARRPYRHVSEHFGFSTASDVVRGAPMPVPFCTAAIATGRTSLDALAARAGAPIGLENLALAFSRRDALDQGPFVAALVRDGFVVLDLHNLWCQAINFEIDAAALLATWPLDRVRELHVSGGRWSTPTSDPRPFRRDSHDHPVPDEVVTLLPLALASCPNVEVVIVERLGTTFTTEADDASFRDDVRRVRAALEQPRPAAVVATPGAAPLAVDADTLGSYQRALLDLAHAARSPAAAMSSLLANRELAPLGDYLDAIEPRGLEIAIELAARWSARVTSHDLG